MLQNTIYNVVCVFILPAIYLIMAWFDFDLIRRAGSQEQRLRMLLGLIAGIVSFILVVFLDQIYGFIKKTAIPDPSDFEVIRVCISFSFLLAAFLMFTTRLIGLRPQQILSFLVLFITFAICISIYFLFLYSEIRSIVAISSFSFFTGLTLDLMLTVNMFDHNK